MFPKCLLCSIRARQRISPSYLSFFALIKALTPACRVAISRSCTEQAPSRPRFREIPRLPAVLARLPSPDIFTPFQRSYARCVRLMHAYAGRGHVLGGPSVCPSDWLRCRHPPSVGTTFQKRHALLSPPQAPARVRSFPRLSQLPLLPLAAAESRVQSSAGEPERLRDVLVRGRRTPPVEHHLLRTTVACAHARGR